MRWQQFHAKMREEEWKRKDGVDYIMEGMNRRLKDREENIKGTKEWKEEGREMQEFTKQITEEKREEFK